MNRLPLFALLLSLPLLFAFLPRMHIAAPVAVSALPAGLHISAPHPNPFTTFTQLTLSTQRSQRIDVEVVNLTGQRKAFLFEGMLPAGEGLTLRFEAGSLPSGVYFFMIRGEHFHSSRKVVLAR